MFRKMFVIVGISILALLTVITPSANATPVPGNTSPKSPTWDVGWSSVPVQVGAIFTDNYYGGNGKSLNWAGGACDYQNSPGYSFTASLFFDSGEYFSDGWGSHVSSMYSNSNVGCNYIYIEAGYPKFLGSGGYDGLPYETCGNLPTMGWPYNDNIRRIVFHYYRDCDDGIIHGGPIR